MTLPDYLLLAGLVAVAAAGAYFYFTKKKPEPSMEVPEETPPAPALRVDPPPVVTLPVSQPISQGGATAVLPHETWFKDPNRVVTTPDPANAGSGNAYDPDGSVVPWNAQAGEGKYLRLQGQVINCVIIPPPAWNGSPREFSCNPIAPANHSRMRVTIGQVASPPLDQQPFGSYGSGFTPNLTGPTMVRIELDVPSAVSFQLVGRE